MKRPQFSLRMVLLVVGLLATICAWRHAVDIERRAEREGMRVKLKSKLFALEQLRDSISDSIQFRISFSGGWEEFEKTKAEISATQKRLESLAP